jgi:hypothetical protein
MKFQGVVYNEKGKVLDKTTPQESTADCVDIIVAKFNLTEVQHQQFWDELMVEFNGKCAVVEVS